ncbi:MAG: hypothetical protein OEY03_11025, partial [Rhizobacter sp.]|nr:hypothetical protein [Rhizobacter sp.]
MNQPDAPLFPATPPDGVLHALLEQGSDLLAVTDGAGRLCWANRRFMQRTGLQCDTQANLLSLLPDAPHSTEARRHMQQALRGAKLADVELRWQAGSGEALWVNATVVRAAGQLIWVLCDVTPQIEASRKAGQLAELLEMAQEFGRIGVWERDALTGRGHWDDHVFRIWGLDPREGTPSFDQARARLHPEDRDLLDDATLRLAPGRHAARYRV